MSNALALRTEASHGFGNCTCMKAGNHLQKSLLGLMAAERRIRLGRQEITEENWYRLMELHMTGLGTVEHIAYTLQWMTQEQRCLQDGLCLQNAPGDMRIWPSLFLISGVSPLPFIQIRIPYSEVSRMERLPSLQEWLWSLTSKWFSQTRHKQKEGWNDITEQLRIGYPMTLFVGIITIRISQ